MKWIKIGKRYRVDIEKVRCYGIPSEDPAVVQFDYDHDDCDKFDFDDEEEARNVLKEVDIALGFYCIDED